MITASDNLASLQTTKSSSTKDNLHTSSVAVDGNYIRGTAFQTLPEAHNWWTVELQHKYSLGRIELHNAEIGMHIYVYLEDAMASKYLLGHFLCANYSAR